MSRLVSLAALAAAFALSACGGGSSVEHKRCRDANSTTIYVNNFKGAVTTAVVNGTFTPAQGDAVLAKIAEIQSKISPSDFGGLCTALDNFRKENPF